MLETIGANGTFSSFSESLTAERTLLGKTGVYANYTAVTTSGAEAAGRVHATCIDKTLYTVHITYPRGYRDTMWIRCMINSAQLSRLLNNAVKGRNTHDKAARAESRAVFVRL